MIGSGELGMGIGVYLEDDFSGPAAAINEGVNDLESSFTKAAGGIEAGIGKMQAGIGGLLSAAALVAPFAVAISMSAELSDALSDVTKTTGITGDALQDLRQTIEGIDTRTSVQGLLEIAKAGGSMGIAQGDIAGFTEAVDKLNVALGDQFASPEVLARDLTKLRNVLVDIKTDNVAGDLLNIGNVLNFMGANAAATEGDIADVASRMAGLGGSLGLTTDQIFGVSTAMLEMGVSSEVLGTNFPLILARIAKDTDEFAKIAGMGSAEFKELVDTNILGAFQAVAAGAKEMAPSASSMATLLDSVGLSGGRVAEVFLKATGAAELINKRVGEAGAALGNTDSIMGEFAAKNENFAAVLEKASKQVGILTTRIGDALAPAVDIAARVFTGILSIFADLVSTDVGKWIVGIVAAATGLIAVAIAWTAVQGLIIPGFVLMAKAALAAFAPFYPFLIAGAAVVGLFMAISRSIDEFNAVLEGGDAGTGMLGFFQQVGGAISGLLQIWKSWNGETFELSEQMHDALERIGILDFVISAGTWIIRLKEFLKGMWDSFKSVGDVGMSAFNRITATLAPLWEAIQKLVGIFFDLDGGLSKNTASVETFYLMGSMLADFLVTGLKVAIEVVAFVITSLVTGVTLAVEAFVWLWNTIKSIFNGTADWSQIGMDIVNGIWYGIQATWDNFVSLFMGLIEALPFADKIMGMMGGTEVEGGTVQANNAEAPDALKRVSDITAKAGAAKVTMEPTVIDNTTTKTESINLNVTLDGDPIYKNMMDREKLEDARAN